MINDLQLTIDLYYAMIQCLDEVSYSGERFFRLGINDVYWLFMKYVDYYCKSKVGPSKSVSEPRFIRLLEVTSPKYYRISEEWR